MKRNIGIFILLEYFTGKIYAGCISAINISPAIGGNVFHTENSSMLEKPLNFIEHYDLLIFLSVEPDEQMRRIRKRNGPEKTVQFAQRWIPFEEMYFRAFRVQERCDIRLEGSSENRKTNHN